ncbi:hypothetical protein [Lacticaseibacillus paracasei]|uniref:hypothetical protein n=1 Tax=Lacticaseibacillus paracasei TaxID=1597 RepID=UPI0030933FCE|nr:hypothetical protein SGY26_05485 [Lacticaseibacillus paracasei]WQG47303.1 hypothetical protein U2Q69_00560 [Lacticaseibacillus casei]
MKTGDDTFDDIYISKETGKVVGVMLNWRDYKLVPISKTNEPISYERAKAFYRATVIGNGPGAIAYALHILHFIYGKEE